MSKPQQLVTEPAEQGTEASPSAADASEPSKTRPRSPTAWVRAGSGYTATIDDRDYRVTKYPPDSPMNAPYGAYAEGRFIGSGSSIDAVKGRCNAHAAKLRFRARG